MIPISVPVLGGHEGQYLLECIETGFVSSVGPFVRRFEQGVAQVTGVPHAVTTCSGTTALHMMLVAAGVRPGDLVLIPSLTFIATANAVSHAHATPWLMDVDPATWALSPVVVAQELARHAVRRGNTLVHRPTNQRIAAILTVHPLGFTGELSELRRLADHYGIALLADGAATIGGLFGSDPIGCAPVDATALSFNGNKVVTTGGGGAVVSRDEALIACIRHISSTARVSGNYEHDTIGYNYRMTNIEAALGCAQLEQLSDFVACRRRIQRFYTETLCPSGAWDAPPAAAATGSGWIATLLSRSSRPEGMQRIREHLRAADIDIRPFWQPVHMQPPYAAVPRSDCPVSENLWWRILTLPTTPALTDSELEYVARSVRTATAASGI